MAKKGKSQKQTNSGAARYAYFGIEEQPVSVVVWVHRDTLRANSYNPNRQAPPELALLKISILEDGWTQPIVVQDGEIIDGFHRWTVSGDPEVYAMTGGMVPIVKAKGKDKTSRQMATIRHNRARGTHTVVGMSNILKDLVASKITMPEICKRLQMEEEEVVRLAARAGIPQTDLVGGTEWSKAWKPV